MPNLTSLKQSKNLIFVFILTIVVSLLIGFFVGKIFEAKKYQKILSQEIEKAKLQEREKTKKEFYQTMQRKYNFPKEPEVIQTVEAILQSKDLKEKSIIVKVTFPYDPLNYLFPDDYLKFYLKEDTEIYHISLGENDKTKREILSLADFFKESNTYLKKKLKIEATENIKGKTQSQAKRIEIWDF